MRDGGKLMRQKVRISFVLSTLLAATAPCWAAENDEIEAFYKGRSVSVIITGSPGSIYDMYARTITQYMSKYIPGNPTFVPRSMIGGGHLVGTNYLYNVAPRDGSVIGSIGETMPLTQVLEPEATRFDGISRNAHRGDQPLLHGLRTEFAETKVVVIRPERITVAFDEETRAGVA